jgi:hypothetical protein
MTTKDDETQMSLDQFRDEVLAALIECQDHDRLRNRLIELIERTAKK